MGKLPTSAWLHFWRDKGFSAVLSEELKIKQSPAKRAAHLVEKFSRVYRVGRKLSTMFVSALSTPALAPAHSPWFPEVDGNELVVVDTNVSQAIDTLSKIKLQKTYKIRENWVRKQAAKIKLQKFHEGVLDYSPRLVQQALYSFCSKSNRVARGDQCALARTQGLCSSCVPRLCPFSTDR